MLHISYVFWIVVSIGVRGGVGTGSCPDTDIVRIFFTQVMLVT